MFSQRVSALNVFPFIPSFKDDGTKEIYSGSFCEASNEFCIPSPSSQVVSLFGSPHTTTKTLFYENHTLNPDIAIHSPCGRIFLGCRDSANLAYINCDRTEISTVNLVTSKFYATSFKLSNKGRLFVGNLYGNPVVYDGKNCIELPLFTNRSYDCLWIDDDYMVISCMSEGRVILCRLLNTQLQILEEFSVPQPYRFSPIQGNTFLLTTRGWLDRPGRVYIFYITNQSSQPSLQLNSYINVPDILFLRKVPSKIYS